MKLRPDACSSLARSPPCAKVTRSSLHDSSTLLSPSTKILQLLELSESNLDPPVTELDLRSTKSQLNINVYVWLRATTHAHTMLVMSCIPEAACIDAHRHMFRPIHFLQAPTFPRSPIRIWIVAIARSRIVAKIEKAEDSEG